MRVILLADITPLTFSFLSCRVKMAALVYLRPSLPSEMEKKYGVTVSGYHKDSGKIVFDGPNSEIEKAYKDVQSQVSNLLTDKFQLEHDILVEQLESIQGELREDGPLALITTRDEFLDLVGQVYVGRLREVLQFFDLLLEF